MFFPELITKQTYKQTDQVIRSGKSKVLDYFSQSIKTKNEE